MLSLAETPPETNADNVLDPHIGWIGAALKFNMEKDTARKLILASGVVHYLPYSETKTASRNTVFKPLFPGYIFVGERRGGSGELKRKPALWRAMDAVKATRNWLAWVPIVDQKRFRADLSYLRRNRDVKTQFIAGAEVQFAGQTVKVDESDELRVVVKLFGFPVSVVADPNELALLQTEQHATPNLST